MNHSKTITCSISHYEYLSSLCHSRHVLIAFITRDLQVKYKQSILGILWAFLKPAITLAAFYFLLKDVDLGFPGLSYHLFMIGPLLLWLWCAQSIMDSFNSLLVHASMLSKIYFHRMILPITCVVVSLVDIAVMMVPTVILLTPMSRWGWMFLVVLWAMIVNIGASLWVSALVLNRRDFKFIIPIVIQLGIFICPIGFSASLIPKEYTLLYSINPMVGICESARWCMVGNNWEYLSSAIGIGMLTTLALVISGYLYFKNTEKRLDEVL